MDRNVWMITPTLTYSVGNAAMDQAVKTAGIGCQSLVVVDKLRSGGVKPANIGLKEAFESEATHIAYINDDTEFQQKNWLKRLIDVLDSDPVYAIVGPSGTCLTKPQCFGRPNLEPGIMEVDQLSWFCVVIKRMVFEKLGFLNEIYWHAGADNEKNDEIRAAGWKLVWVKDVYIHHRLTSPTTEKGRCMRVHDRELYESRRGRRS